jgi:putative transposase
MTLWLVDQYKVSINRACKCVQLGRSVFYYKPDRRDDSLLRMLINEIAKTRIRYGFWRIYILLKREGLQTITNVFTGSIGRKG